MIKIHILIFCMCGFLVTLHSRTILSVNSGNWNSPATWAGGIIPTQSDSVIIATWHVISISANDAACGDLYFLSLSSQLAFTTTQSILSIFGNFTLFSGSHHAIAQWTDGAKIIFKGNKAIQLLSGWSSAETATSFPEIVIDKTAGKVITSGTNMRFGIGSKLEVISGTFELAATDDIETVDLQNSPTRAVFIVHQAGTLTIAGGSSYIRRGSITSADSSRTGKWRVFGTLNLVCSQANRLNFGGIDIEQGGMVTINNGWQSKVLNADTIRVKAGGNLIYKTNINVWHSSLHLRLDRDGNFINEALNMSIPSSLTFNGNIHYALNSGEEQVLSPYLPTYYRLILSGKGSRKLTVPVAINSELVMRGSAFITANSFAISYSDTAGLAYESDTLTQNVEIAEWPADQGPGRITIDNSHGVNLPFNRTVSRELILKKGLFNTSNIALSLLDSAGIVRYNGGSINNSPVFSSANYLAYANTDSAIITGQEMPTNTIIHTIRVTGTRPVILSADCSVAGTVECSGSQLNTGTHSLTFLASSLPPAENNSAYISGNAVMGYRQKNQLGSGFLGLAFPATTDAATIRIERVTGTPIQSTHNQSIAAVWKTTTNSSIADTILLHWQSGCDNGKVFNAQNPPEVWMSLNSGISWSKQQTLVRSSDFHTVSFLAPAAGWFTISDRFHPLAGDVFTMTVSAVPEGLWNGVVATSDTLVAELHEMSSPYSLLGNDKQYLTPQGSAVFHFYNIANNTGYYVVIRHRNSIDLWSGTAVYFNNSSSSYDFTGSRNATYGANTIFKSGKYCMYSGDVNQDGFIDFSDLTLIDNDSFNFTSGYVNTDLNGDLFVDFSDLTLADNNSYNYIGVVRP
ncbi:MAG: hypothetical protein HYV28_03405 [Ignavibacteriales bacterium]|nr:hypothetical protein [Ignavibacteriales bacterium]